MLTEMLFEIYVVGNFCSGTRNQNARPDEALPE